MDRLKIVFRYHMEEAPMPDPIGEGEKVCYPAVGLLFSVCMVPFELLSC